jgi:D-alanyl-D-alanine carboxypeptidase
LKRRLFIAVSLLASSVSSAFAAEPLDFSPQPPAIQAGSWVLMDYTTGQILTAGNEHQQRNPASLTKLMTGMWLIGPLIAIALRRTTLSPSGVTRGQKATRFLTAHR